MLLDTPTVPPPWRVTAEDLSDEHLETVLRIAKEAFMASPSQGKVLAQIASTIRVACDKELGKGWSVVVGRRFGAFVTQRIKAYGELRFRVGIACAWPGTAGTRIDQTLTLSPMPLAAPSCGRTVLSACLPGCLSVCLSVCCRRVLLQATSPLCLACLCCCGKLERASSGGDVVRMHARPSTRRCVCCTATAKTQQQCGALHFFFALFRAGGAVPSRTARD